MSSGGHVLVGKRIQQFTGNWWTFLVRGVISIAFGIVAVAWPEQLGESLTLVVGVVLTVYGLLTILSALFRRDRSEWIVPPLVMGLIAIVAGALILLNPSVILWAAGLLIGLWAVVSGIVGVVSTLTLRQHGFDWALLIAAALAIIAGGALMIYPLTGVQLMVLITGICALVVGFVLLALAWRLRSLRARVGRH